MRIRVHLPLIAALSLLVPVAVVQAQTSPGEGGWVELEAPPVFENQQAVDRLVERKRSLVEDIMARRELEAGRAFDPAWARSQGRLLETRSQSELEAMRDGREDLFATRALGSPGEDLVFTPLETACRALDTRVDSVAGSLITDVPYPFNVTVNMSGQGGLSNCGIPFGRAVAVVANVLAVDPQGKGNFQIWDPTGPKGDSSINFAAKSDLDINLINGVILPICDPSQFLCPIDLNIETNFANSDALINVSGYFSRAPVEDLFDYQDIGDVPGVTTSVRNAGSVTIECPVTAFVHLRLTGRVVFFAEGTSLRYGFGTSPGTFDLLEAFTGNLDGTRSIRFYGTIADQAVVPCSPGSNTYYATLQKSTVFDAGSINVGGLYLTATRY